jgi:hypothetical protein
VLLTTTLRDTIRSPADTSSRTSLPHRGTALLRATIERSDAFCNVLGWIGVHDDLMRSSDTRSRVGIEAGTFRARFDEMKFLHKAKRNEYQFTLESGQTISLGAVNLREPAEKVALEGAGPRDSCEITIEIVKTGPTLVGYKAL